MNNAVILQHIRCPSEYSHLIELTFQRHLRYCQYHHFDFRFEASQPPDKLLSGDWYKVWMIKQALESQYEYVIWVDSDAMIYDVRLDLRMACIKPVGAVLFDNPYIHINTGVLYFKNSETTRAMVDEWYAGKPGIDNGALSWEQGVLCELAKKWQDDGRIGYLDNMWNSVDFITPSPCPVVKAWHGYRDIGVRIDRMKEAIARYDFANPVA